MDLGPKFDWETNTLDVVIEYKNFDFAESKINQKSTGNYVFLLAGIAISHLSKLQLIIALSNYKAEKVVICKIRKIAVSLEYFIAKLGFWKKSI